RGLIRNFRQLESRGSQVAAVADRLYEGKSDPTACPGVKGFTDDDWASLSKLSSDSRPDRDLAEGPPSEILQSLPSEVQKNIKETRARCQQAVDNVPSGDVGLVTFTVSGKQAVLVDPKLLCDGCYHGENCTNRDTRDVRVYVLFGDAWKKVLSN